MAKNTFYFAYDKQQARRKKSRSLRHRSDFQGGLGYEIYLSVKKDKIFLPASSDEMFSQTAISFDNLSKACS